MLYCRPLEDGFFLVLNASRVFCVMETINVAFYQFAKLHDPVALKQSVFQDLSALGIKGSILLAHEGINGFLAGSRSAIGIALQKLRSIPEFQILHVKESISDSVPFSRFVVKVKKEIVTFHQEVEPSLNSPHLLPNDLKKWIDEGRDFILLDTRNEYEYRLGTFHGATSLKIDHFVDFADQVEKKLPEWKDKTIVTFCTGGIRCEKAAPFMASIGYKNVYQLDNGILGYFETVGGSHWDGECFVFDQRISLNSALQSTGSFLCPQCQGPTFKNENNCIHCGFEIKAQ